MSSPQTLTPDQQAAVDAQDGAFLLNAPPGAGKTEVLVRRVMRLLRESPGENFRVLALTYTTRAAEAISRRIGADIADEAWRLTAETIHAFARQMLNSYGEPIGVRPGFSIISGRPQRLAALAQALDDRGLTPSAIVESDAVAMLTTLDTLRSLSASDELAARVDLAPLTNAEVLSAYSQVLDTWHSLDFPGLLWRLLSLLETDPFTQRHLGRLHRYVLLDEAQDCTPTQMAIVDRLVAGTGNIFVVASEQQSIYAFGGADPDRVLGGFRERYDPTVLTLTSNFRSAERIVARANALAEHLPDRHRVSMIATGTATGRVDTLSLATEDDEANAVVEWIEGLLTNGLDPETLEPNEDPAMTDRDIAVLARTRWGLEGVAARLAEAGYQVALRLSEDGAVTSRSGMAVHATLQALANVANPTARQELQSLAGEAAGEYAVGKSSPGENLAIVVLDDGVGQVVDDYVRGTVPLGDLVAALLALQGTEDESDVAWVVERDELARCWAAFTARTLPEDRTLTGFLAQLTRLREATLAQPGIRLLTLHAAKGAEFKAVAVMGLNEGTIPYYLAVQDGPKAVNDERQALYVAITRPSRALLVTRSRTVLTKYGTTKNPAPSRFLAEMSTSNET